MLREILRLTLLLLQHRTTRRLISIAIRAGTAELNRRLQEGRPVHVGGLR